MGVRLTFLNSTAQDCVNTIVMKIVDNIFFYLNMIYCKLVMNEEIFRETSTYPMIHKFVMRPEFIEIFKIVFLLKIALMLRHISLIN